MTRAGSAFHIPLNTMIDNLTSARLSSQHISSHVRKCKIRLLLPLSRGGEGVLVDSLVSWSVRSQPSRGSS